MDATARLPDEMLSSLLDNLGQPGVLSAAGVSKRWRRVATAHRDYYQSASLDRTSRGPYDMSWRPRGLQEFFDAMASDAPKLGVQICFEEPNGGGVSLAFTPHGLQRMAGPGMMAEQLMTDGVIPALKDQAARLVKLELSISECYAPAMLDVLRVPLPYLRRLELYVSFSEHRTVGATSYPTLDLGLLSCPVLTNLTLGNVHLQPASALNGVTALSLSYRTPPPDPMRIAARFPSLIDLTVKINCTVDDEAPFPLDFAGVSLLRLCLEHGTTQQWISRIAEQFPLAATSHVTVLLYEDNADLSPVLAGLDGPLAVHIRTVGDGDDEKEVTLSARESGLVRVIREHPYALSDVMLPALRQLRALAPRIVEMRMSHENMSAMFDIGAADFPALRVLRLDLDDRAERQSFWPLPEGKTTTDMQPTTRCLRCPQLSSVVLHDSNKEAHAPAEELLDFLACIGVERTLEAKLVLAGVDVTGGPEKVGALFSQVVHEV